MSARRTRNTADLIAAGALEIGDGYRAKNAEFSPQGGLPFVRVGDVGFGTLRLDGLDELPNAQRQKYEPKVARTGDSLITMKGTVGRVAFVGEGDRPFVYSPQISYWRSKDTAQLDPRWLSYWLEGEEFAQQALATKGATDMADYINLRDQRRMQITLPPANEQAAVARVLSTLDGLILNNRRRVALLEEMARTIYREWFVRYRYPGHEDVPLVDSPLGPIPDGWHVEVTGELQRSGLLDIGDGYRAKHLEMSDDGAGLPFVRVANVRDGYLDLRSVDRLPVEYGDRLRSKVSRMGDVVVSMKGTVGRQALVDVRHPRMVYSPQVSFWRSLDQIRLPSVLLYEWIRSDAFVQQCAASKGATAMADYVNLGDQRRMHMLLPNRAVAAHFDAEVGPMSELASGLRWQTDSLGALRDILLPKLVSGAIDVSSLDLDRIVASA